jgi:hypothetical protein
MLKKYTYLILIMSALSCFKDENDTTMTTIKNDPRYIIDESELVIEVADENEKPVVGLTASYNGEIKLVNKSSFFHFEGKKVNKFEELLKITDQNGYDYDYLIHSQANEVNYKKINVFINKENASFASNVDFALPITPNIKVNLSKDNYLINLNQNYTGNIELKYNHFDIQNESHLKTLPGGKFGVKDNQLWLLQMEDAFTFNVYSTDKQKLSFKNPVTIFLSTVKSGSALFYYDADSHVWTYLQDVASNQQVLTNRHGTYCIAQIKAFSILKGQWMINQLPARQSLITLTSANINEEVLTSNNGRWEAIVPIGENITISYTLSCAQTESKSINVTDTKFDVGTHMTSSSNYVPYQISGLIKDCNGGLIEEGFLKIRSERINKTLYIDSSAFNFSVPLCEGDLVSLSCTTITADYETTTLDNVPYYIDLSSIYLCDDFKDNYLVLNMDGFIRKYTSFEKTVNSEIIQIGASSFDSPIFLKFGHTNMVGQIDNNKANIVWYDEQIAGYGVSLNCPTSSTCGFTNVEITYWSQNSNLAKGRFEGRFWLKTLNPVGAEYKNISGEFQLKQ